MHQPFKYWLEIIKTTSEVFWQQREKSTFQPDQQAGEATVAVILVGAEMQQHDQTTVIAGTNIIS